jgi:hypothetical protein
MDALMNSITDKCIRHILRHPDKGMGNAELATWCVAYRALSREDRGLVQIELVKARELAVVIGPYGAAKFYGRSRAPDGAFSMGQRQGDELARAMRLT